MKLDVTSRGIKKAQEVEPFKNPKDIAKIKQFLLGKENKRDYLMFVLGINVGLRAGDLLGLKIKDVFHNGIIADKVIICEEKTDKRREFGLNKNAKESIMLYLNTMKVIDEDSYLFSSRKGTDALLVESAHHIINKIVKELGVKGNYGTHSMRKTFAYHVYINGIKDNPGILDTLQNILNHSSSKVTLRYIGITKEVISSVYMNLNL